MRKQGRHFQRHPSVHTFRLLVDWLELVGGPGDVLQSQVKKECLVRFALAQLFADCGIVSTTVLDGMIENRGIRSKPRHRKFGDIALERAAVQQIACDVIEPDTLAQIVK